MQISSSIRTNIESKRQVRYELMNPTSIRRKRPGESKQSKRARARAKQARIRKEVEEERCKERERLSRIINAARLPYIKKSEEKKPSMPHSHNYRRKVLITKNNQRNYYKNKSSLLGRNLHYYRLCVFVSRTRRVKGKGRKNRQCYVARALCEKKYNNENTPGKTGFDNAMMYDYRRSKSLSGEKMVQKSLSVTSSAGVRAYPEKKWFKSLFPSTLVILWGFILLIPT